MIKLVTYVIRQQLGTIIYSNVKLPLVAIKLGGGGGVVGWGGGGLLEGGAYKILNNFRGRLKEGGAKVRLMEDLLYMNFAD